MFLRAEIKVDKIKRVKQKLAARSIENPAATLHSYTSFQGTRSPFFEYNVTMPPPKPHPPIPAPHRPLCIVACDLVSRFI